VSLDMLIFVQVCKTIDKNLVFLISSIGSEEQIRAMESTRIKLDIIKSTSSEAVHQKLTSSEVLKIIRS